MSGRIGIFAAVAVLAGASTALAMGPIGAGDVQMVDGMIEKSVSGQPGDPVSGRAIASNRKLGNCLACHAIADQDEHLFHGEVGPELNGVADRWSEPELRAIVVNSKEALSDETIMPGFYTFAVGKDVREDLIGKTILSAQEVEDVVAYLMTLKEE